MSVSDKIDHLRNLTVAIGELTEKTFEDEDVEKDNLEDFRIYVGTALIEILKILEEMNQK